MRWRAAGCCLVVLAGVLSLALLRRASVTPEPQGAAKMPPGEESFGVYTCPMHPDVRVPMASCPICGMRLQPLYKEDGITVGLRAHQDHEQKHGGLFSMTGDYHVECVEKEREFHVYLYDAFTKPIATEGLHGKLYHLSDQQPMDFQGPLALEPDAAREYLVAQKPAGVVITEVSLVIPYQNTEIQVNFPLRPTLEGKIISLACYLADGIAGADDPECTRRGFEAGLPPALLIGDFEPPAVYLLTDHVAGTAPQAATTLLQPYMGRNVRVRGRLLRRRRWQMLELTEIAFRE